MTSQSPLVVFPFLYLISSSIVLAVSAHLASDTNSSSDGLGFRRFLGLGALGVALALFNEITYLAVPVSLVILLVARWLHTPDANLTAWRPFRSWAVMTAGFLVVFLPVRIAIALGCSDGTCYAASDLGLSFEAVGLWVQRVAGSSFVVGWGIAGATLDEPFTPSPRILVTNWSMLILSGVLVAGAMAAARRLALVPSDHDRRLSIGLAIVGLGIVGFASALASLSVKLQESDVAFGMPWRESALSAVGWALITTAVLLSVRNSNLFRGRLGVAVTALGLSLFLVVSLYANTAASSRLRNETESTLHIRVSSEMVPFGVSEEADSRRCGLLHELETAYASKGNDASETLRWINEASILANDRPFCAGG